MTGPAEVIVTVAEDHRGRIDDVVAALAGIGLEDVQVLGAVGAVTGRLGTSSAMAAARALEGVEAVEVAGSFQLPPPDDALQ